MQAQPITIRAAVSSDVAFLRKMMWEAITASPALITQLGTDVIQQRESEYWQDWLIQPDPAFVAVDANDRSVGAIVLQPGEGGGWRIGIGVEADVRGYGIGRRLIERAIAFARTGGVAHIELSVDPDNVQASNLYLHMGFVEVGAKNNLIEMRLDLV